MNHDSKYALTADRPSPRERVSFNSNWRFLKEDTAGAREIEYDDSGWRELDLPHDWAIEGPFSDSYNARCGGLPFHGIGWYRKHFRIPESGRDRIVTVEFDGIMCNSTLWINGHLLGSRPYGYIGFVFELTPFLRYGNEENVIAVKAAPEDLSSRWYPGAGVYRNVWLTATEPVHIEHRGVSITTPEVSESAATVTVTVRTANAGEKDKQITLETVIEDRSGNAIVSSASDAAAKTGGAVAITQNLQINQPELWDVDTPSLYTAYTRITHNNKALDECRTAFGIRSIEFNPETGCILNGRHIKLKGVCLHHDLGPLGAAVNRRATQRQLEILKSMGCNAVRTSHNPPSPEQLEFCDRLGLLVQVEAFDCWEMGKIENGYNKYFAEWHERDLRDMIRRDRNHPCVIMWSIGNEILEQGSKDGWKIAKHLTDICHDEDPTRPVTAGFNNFEGCLKNKLAEQVDLVGFNYKPINYQQVMKKYPDWIVYGAETESTVSSRGVYHLPLENPPSDPCLQVSSYDLESPPWGYPPDVEFDTQKRLPNVLGEFVWTGFDYLGEPTPFGGRDNSTNGYWNDDWPARSSYFGIIDLCGFPKDRFYLYQSVWTDDPMVHILPHWNWEKTRITHVPVFCYTNCDEAELFLNGRSLGEKTMGADPVDLPVKLHSWPGGNFQSRYRLKWTVPYEPGELKAVGYRDGTAVCEKSIVTAGPAARITLAPDRQTILANGLDLSFITVKIEDDNGTLCPLADNLVEFEVTGPAEIAAVDNGNPATAEPFKANHRKAFNGLCMLIIRAEKSKPGAITVTAKSQKLQPARTVVQAQPPLREI